MRHAIFLEPDADYRALLDRVFGGLHWACSPIDSLEEAEARIPGAWAAVLSLESGDVASLDRLRALQRLSPETVICVLIDELYPDFDRQLRAAGVDAVICKPVQEREIVEALVAGFTARRGGRRE